MKSLVFILLFVLNASATAKTVVVSDIDDTIKVAHVLGAKKGFTNAYRTHNVFFGMSQLYHLIANQNSGTQFYYLSNAPKTFMERSHRQFLKDNKFPAGRLMVRESLSDKEHKIRALRRILKDPSIELVLFLGDNAEQDPVIYAQAVKEFPHLKYRTFIRHAYSSNEATLVGDDQMSFVTPVEISLELKKMDLLKDRDVNTLEAQYAHFVIRVGRNEGYTGTLAFPNWVNCQEFQIPQSLKERQTDASFFVLAKVEHHCSPG